LNLDISDYAKCNSKPVNLNKEQVLELISNKSITYRHKVPKKLKPFRWLEFLAGCNDDPKDPENWGFEHDYGWAYLWQKEAFDTRGESCRLEPVFGGIGRIAWVREPFGIFGDQEEPPLDAIRYRCHWLDQMPPGVKKWKNSTQMLKKYSRIIVKIVDLKVEPKDNWFEWVAELESVYVSNKPLRL
jgi:hypothetical protein